MLAAGAATAGQFDAWQNSSKITINYREYEELQNVTVLVTLGSHIPGFSYSQFSSSNGYDLRFEDEFTNSLPYEIDTWNPAGTSYVWVRIPSLRGNANTNAYPGQWLLNMVWEGQPVYATTLGGYKITEGPNNLGVWSRNQSEGLANVGYYNLKRAVQTRCARSNCPLILPVRGLRREV